MRTRALMTPRGRVEEAEALKPGRAAGMVIVSARTVREMLPLATVVVVVVAASIAEVVAVAMVSSIAGVVAAAVAVVAVAPKGNPAAPPAELLTEPHSIGGTRTTPTSSTQTLTTLER